MRQSFLVWTESIVYSLLLISATCHAWGYHHPAAIRLPTEKPTTTTTTRIPSTSAPLPTSTVSPVTEITSTTTTLTKENVKTASPTTESKASTGNDTSPAPSSLSTEGIPQAFSTTTRKSSSTTTSFPKSSDITEPTTVTTTSARVESTTNEPTQTTTTEAATTKVNNSEESLHSTTAKGEASTHENDEKIQPSSVTTTSSSPITAPAETRNTSMTSVATVLIISTELPAVKNVSDNATKSATTACVRNESEVSYWDFGYCGMNCSSNAECNNQQKEQCICDGPCGMSCLQPDLVYCDAPGPVENGKALLVGELGLYDYRNQLQRFMHNQKVIFECDEGFTLIDGPQEKICRNGLWFPAVGEPKCIFSDTPGFRWMQSNRVKRRAIKSGGTGSLARSKVGGGGGGGGGGGARRGRKRGGNVGAEEEDFEPGDIVESSVCSSLDEIPEIQIEIISRGSDPNNTDVSEGAVVRVSCTHGYGFNLQNDTITCDEKGKWRPKVPQCNPLPCKVPYIPHGTFYMGGKALFFLEMKQHGSNIVLSCSKGYVLNGPSESHCWYGEWDLSDAPECIPASCDLPQLDRGKYASRYRAGMVVGHGTEVDYHCDGDYQKMAPGGPAKCHLGEWRPNKPACFHPSYIHGLKNYTHDKDNKLITSIKRSCGVPQKEKGAIFYVEGKPIDYDTDYIFPDGTKVMYRCAAAKPKLKNRWKMICEDGQWVGGLQNLTCEMNATIMADLMSIKETIRMINSSCTYRKKETHVVTFFNDQQLTMETTEFSPGSVLINRCIDIGKFKLVGAVRRKCISGQWLGITPKCEGLSQYYDYVVDKPPTILFRYLNGSIVQTNDGSLMVYPGTTVHMECLYIRKFGRPQWNVSNTNKVYAEGWTDGIEHRDPMLEYRLTIDDASDDDSGTFSCITPSRHGHEIKIEVKSEDEDASIFMPYNQVDCPPLPEVSDLVYSTDSTMLGTKVNFTCKDSNFLIGAPEIICQATGSWSASVPKCENVECPDISMVPAMAPLAHTSVTRNGTLKRNETAPPKITILGRDVGGKAIFSCSQGYMVEGASEAVCQPTGEWSSAIPLCKEVECPPPPSPQYGYVTGNPPYKAGDLAQFECRPGHMMEGQPIIACQDSGKWSRASSTTKCVKACTYPGTTIGGTISAVKFYYPIGETVEFDCTEGYDLQGSRMLHCLDTAKWSTTIPNCIPREGSGRGFQKLTAASSFARNKM